MIMAVNKVVYGGSTLIDLTTDTVTADTLLNGATAHNRSGVSVTGTVTFQTIYTGTAEPSASVGVNGDIYVRTS